MTLASAASSGDGVWPQAVASTVATVAATNGARALGPAMSSTTAGSTGSSTSSTSGSFGRYEVLAELNVDVKRSACARDRRGHCASTGSFVRRFGARDNRRRRLHAD